MTGVKGQSGPEAKRWVTPDRHPSGGLRVMIPPRMLREIGVEDGREYVVMRRVLEDRHSVVLEFRLKERVPEAERA